jgi:KDO2-lipid IV(A) lauroyltransferase
VSGLKSIEREMWVELGSGLWEFARLARLSPEGFRRDVRIVGWENVVRAREEGRGIVFVTAHLGNWEYTAPAAAVMGLPVAAIARRIKNPFVDRWVTGIRSRLGVTVISHRAAVRESLRRLKAGEAVGLLIDHRISAGGLAVPFFGRPALTTSLAALLALRTRAPVIPVFSVRDGSGIRVEFRSPFPVPDVPADPASLRSVTEGLTRVVEGWVREHPAQWLWIHDRWKI